MVFNIIWCKYIGKSMELKTNPINPALWKPHNLILGADRVLIIILSIVTILIIFTLRNWVAFIFGPIMFYTVWKLLQKLALKDPLFLKTAFRHMMHQKYYPAGGSFPGCPTVVQYYFNPKIGARTAGFSIFWSIFYLIFRNSEKAPSQDG